MMNVTNGELKEKEFVSKHLPGLLDTIEDCGKNIEVDCLELSHGFSACHLSLVSNFLQNSRLVELVLGNADFSNALASVAESLTRSSVKVLRIDSTKLSANDIICLAHVFKDTQITNLSLKNLSVNLTEKQTEEFILHLSTSGINDLSISCSDLLEKGAALFIRSLPNTAVTSLSLFNCFHSKEAQRSLFSILPKTVITTLNLGHIGVTDIELEALTPTLCKSELKSLNLLGNDISDAGVDILAKALVGSKVTNLCLRNNQISGKNKLSFHLKDTNIDTLTLSCNNIVDPAMFSCPCFPAETSLSTLNLRFCCLGDNVGRSLMRRLKYSKVNNLDVACNNLGLETVCEFASVVKDTNITQINFSGNPIPAEGLSILSECLAGSKVEKFVLGRPTSNIFVDQVCIGAFNEKLKSVNINFIIFQGIPITNDYDEVIGRSLMDTKFTHLDVSFCSIDNSVITTLAAHLKSTNITHLYLDGNKIGDVGAMALAVCLPETKIKLLSVRFNNITACGAQYLASCLKHSSLYVLNVENDNVFDEQDLKNLAKTIKETFVTDFSAGNWMEVNCHQFIIKPVLWKNQVKVSRLLEFIQKISPRTQGSCFNFNFYEDSCFDKFSYECLRFCDTIKQPAAINALEHAESLSILRKGLIKLLQEEFPRQFFLFLESRLNAVSKCGYVCDLP